MAEIEMISAMPRVGDFRIVWCLKTDPKRTRVKV